jgi:hypothetical protein
VTPSQVFSKQLYFVNKEPFLGYLKIYAVDEAGSGETLIGNYQPNETCTDYKRYGIPNCRMNESFVVRTICKRRYVPVVFDQDYVVPSNINALRLAMTSIVYEEQNDPGRRDTEFQRALDLLNSELRSFRGGANMTLRINPGAFQLANLYAGR